MKKARYLLVNLMVILNFQCAVSAGERFSSTMGEVLLRNLQPGQQYHLTSLLKFPLRVTYEGEKPVTILIDPALPEPNEMKKNYEPIPDIRWVKVSPSSFESVQSTTVETNVSISIPDDDALLGRKFIVYLWSHTIGAQKGMHLGLGVKSRLLISIAKEKNVETSTAVPSSYMDFKITPAAVSLKAIKPGQTVTLDAFEGQSLRIENFGDEDREFSLQGVPGGDLDMDPPQGLEWGPLETELVVTPAKVRVAKGKTENFRVTLKIPERPASYGRKYHFLVRATPEGIGMTSGILFRMNVDTIDLRQ